MIILVPAYQPDHRLVDLVRELRQALPTAALLVVDDGSGPAHRQVFDQAQALGAELLTHPVNLGKGSALKTGLSHIRRHLPGRDVVCADSDGQHTPGDIRRVAAAVRPGTIVLGARQFVGRVPARSRFGNELTRLVFAAATGSPVRDTQTGLRAYPPDLLDWLVQVPGDRFEYEMSVLLAARRAGYEVLEVPIRTIYLDANASSHFRPVVDSLRVYRPVLKFAASSLLAFGVDTAMLLLLAHLTGDLLVAVVGARLVSAATNFAVNRWLVFDHGRSVRLHRSAVRYLTLAVLLLGANYLLLHTLTGIGLPLLAAKVLTELTLVTASYLVQRHHVFGAGRRTARSAPRVRAAGELSPTRSPDHPGSTRRT